MNISRFAILVIINLPLIVIAVIGTLTSYKTGRISKKRCRLELLFWVVLGGGLIITEPLYNLLLASHLTDSDPMSIFDMVLLTLLVLSALWIKSMHAKAADLQRKFSLMHEHLAIKEAEYDKELENR